MSVGYFPLVLLCGWRFNIFIFISELFCIIVSELYVATHVILVTTLVDFCR